MRWLLALLALLSAAAAAVYLFTSWHLAEELIRPRNPEHPDTSIPEGVDRTLRVVRPDEVVIDTWVLLPRAPKPPGAVNTVVVLHGISDQKRSMISLGRRFQRHGVMAVMIDLRGHGLSSAVPITYGARDVDDIAAVLDVVNEDVAPVGEVGAYGPSYGAAVALQLPAADPRVTRVVAVASFASMRRLVRPHLEEEWASLAWMIPDALTDILVDRAGALAGFDPDEASPERRVAESTARMLVVHSPQDETIPYQDALDIVANCGDRCELLTLEGKDHLASLSNLELRRALHRFLVGEEWTGH